MTYMHAFAGLYAHMPLEEKGVCLKETKRTHPPLPAQVLFARHFISPALQMDADGNKLFELHS